MHFVIRKSVEGFRDRLVGQLLDFADRLALDEFRGHGAGSNRAGTAEGFKLDVFDHIVLDLQVHPHDVAALGVADFPDAVCILDDADIAGVAEMVHDFFTV